MENQTSTTELIAIDMDWLQAFQRSMANKGISMQLTHTNSPKIMQISITYPGSPKTFRCLIHFDDPEGKINTLEDGGQIYNLIRNNCQPGEGVDTREIQTEIMSGGWKISQGHVYISTNRANFQRDTLNLGTIMVYVMGHISEFIKNVR